MHHATYFLVQSQYDWLAKALPAPQAPHGRPAIPNRELLGGILFVLKTGCRWQDIPASICRHGYSSCWRRLRYWQRCAGLQAVWQRAVSALDARGRLDLSVGNIDGSLVEGPKFEAVGGSGKHRCYGTNLSLVTDREGLPLSEVLTPGNRHDQYSAAATLTKLRAAHGCQVVLVNADKGYDAKHFRQYLAEQGIAANIPPRAFVRRPRLTPVGYDRSTYRLRRHVERTFAWLKYFRRLRYRWERSREMFQAFVDLGCMVICVRRAGF